MTLDAIRFNEIKQVNTYIGHIRRNSNVEDIKIAWNKEGYRPDNQWEFIAVKFKDGISETALIQAVIDVHADDYLGKLGEYHVFWFD